MAEQKSPIELLGLAVDAIERLIEDDPEWAGSKFIDTGCQHCTDGNTPARFDRGLCWRHQAALVVLQTQPREAA